MDLGLRNAAAVVTGGSKGMGRATAESLAREGARVAVLARSEAALSSTKQRLIELGSPEVLALSADLTDARAIADAFVEIESRFDEVNVLVNVAGPVEVGIKAFEDLDDAEWVATFDIGTLSAVRCVRSALPLLRRARMGAHRERLRTFDETAVTDPDRLHRRQGRAHQPHEEPLADACDRRDSRQLRLDRARSTHRACAATSKPCQPTAPPIPTTCTTSCGS